MVAGRVAIDFTGFRRLRAIPLASRERTLTVTPFRFRELLCCLSGMSRLTPMLLLIRGLTSKLPFSERTSRLLHTFVAAERFGYSPRLASRIFSFFRRQNNRFGGLNCPQSTTVNRHRRKV